MAKKLGNDYRLFVGDGEAVEDFIEVGGQRDLTIDRNSQEIDIGDKNSAPYNLTKPGNFTLRITCGGVLDLPDDGYARLDELFKGQEPGNFQVRTKPYESEDVVFEGEMNVLSLSASFPRNAEGTWNLALGANKVPDKDELSPDVES